LATLSIVVDVREKASGIPLTLERLGVKVSYRSLTVGGCILSEDRAVEGFGRLRAEMIVEVLEVFYRPSKSSGSEGQTPIDRKDCLEA
jgi:ERCC4-type nuclease